jgi:hypothetical protein
VDLKPFRQNKGPGFKAKDHLDFNNIPKRDPFAGQARRLPDEVIDNARARMLDIAKRANQQTTKKQNFDKLIENEKKKKRGGAPGNVVELGKRKQLDPDNPTMLRKTKSESKNTKQRIYGPKTEIFNIA